MTAQQDAYAKAIVQHVRDRGLPSIAAVIAIETAITESGIQMYANGNNPRSLQLPHDTVGWDHGSVGIFQQQVGGAINSTANWGTTDELMNVTISTDKFLNQLIQFNYQAMNTWDAAQRVQGSFDPTGGNYKRSEAQARGIVNQYWASTPTTQGEEPMIIIMAPSGGIGVIVPGGKYHLDGNEWTAINAIHASNPGAAPAVRITDAQWNALAEKRGRI